MMILIAIVGSVLIAGLIIMTAKSMTSIEG